jgi:hypothetical protein
LRHFLSQATPSQLTMVLNDVQFFKTNCPRLLDLLRIYGHKMRIFETNDNAKVAKDCFVIADKNHYVKRIHIDQARFKFAFDDAVNCADLQLRFEEILAETIGQMSISNLGL